MTAAGAVEAPGELRGCYLAVPERAGQGPEVSAAGRGVGGLGDTGPSEGTASCVCGILKA